MMGEGRVDWPLEEDWLVRGLQIISSQQDTVDRSASGPAGLVTWDRGEQGLRTHQVEGSLPTGSELFFFLLKDI